MSGRVLSNQCDMNGRTKQTRAVRGRGVCGGRQAGGEGKGVFHAMSNLVHPQNITRLAVEDCHYVPLAGWL